jgi:hypothetical protein
MAKIGTLNVTTIKIANGSISQFFAPSGASVTVTNSSGGPTMVFVSNSNAAGSTTLTRNRDSKVLFTGGGYLRGLAVDDDPNTTETYTVSGTGASIVRAFVRRK